MPLPLQVARRRTSLTAHQADISGALYTGPRLELTLPVDRATWLRRLGLPGPSGASKIGALAPLGERRNGIAEVAGSIPARSRNRLRICADAGVCVAALRLRRSVAKPLQA